MFGTATNRRLVLVCLGLLVVLGSLGAGVVAADNNSTDPDYYDNSSNDTGQDVWMQGHEDPTIANITHYVALMQNYVIGGGMNAQGGVGSAGALLVGGIVVAIGIGTGVGSGLGTQGGVALGTALLGTLSGVGLLPEWMFALMLFLLGLSVLTSFIRSQR